MYGDWGGRHELSCGRDSRYVVAALSIPLLNFIGWIDYTYLAHTWYTSSCGCQWGSRSRYSAYSSVLTYLSDSICSRFSVRHDTVPLRRPDAGNYGFSSYNFSSPGNCSNPAISAFQSIWSHDSRTRSNPSAWRHFNIVQLLSSTILIALSFLTMIRYTSTRIPCSA